MNETVSFLLGTLGVLGLILIIYCFIRFCVLDEKEAKE